MKNFGDLRSAVQSLDHLEIARLLKRYKDPRLEEYVISSLGYFPPTQFKCPGINLKPYQALKLMHPERTYLKFFGCSRRGNTEIFELTPDDLDHFYEFYVNRLFEEAFVGIVDINPSLQILVEDYKDRILKRKYISSNKELVVAINKTFRGITTECQKKCAAYATLGLNAYRDRNTMTIFTTLISVLYQKKKYREIDMRGPEAEKRHFEQRVMHHRVMLELGVKRMRQ